LASSYFSRGFAGYFSEGGFLEDGGFREGLEKRKKET